MSAFITALPLWSRRPPNSRETQKALKWPKSDSKVTRPDRPQSDPKVTQKWLRTHFWVTFESLGVTLGWGTFESLLGHFNSFCVSLELGGRLLPNITIRTETITNENLEILFRFRFCNGKANRFLDGGNSALVIGF